MIAEGLAGLADAAHDVCIVGAGPVGITLALELAAGGKRVLVLESGRRASSAATQELSKAEVLDPDVHDDMRICVSRQLGGTSNLWGGRCQPFDPVDFLDRSSLSGAVWPIGFADVEPYFAKAAFYCSCGDPVFRAPLSLLDGRDDRVVMTRLERFSNKPAFQKAHARPLESNPNVDVRLNATVVAIEISGDGCATHVTVSSSDGNTKVPVKTLVLAMGGLESTRLLLFAQRRQPYLFGGPDGPLGRYYMAHVVGEVADITWSSEEIDAAYDFFVDDHGSYVRRRLVPHDKEILSRGLPNVAFWPVVFPVADARHRSAILSMVFLALSAKPIGRLILPEVIRRFHAPEGVSKAPHVLNVLKGLPGAVAYAPWFFHRRYFQPMRLPGFFVRNAARTYGLSFHSEHFASAESRVWLGDDVDSRGMPRLTIDLRFSRRDAEALLRAHQLLDTWLRDSGHGFLRYRQPEDQTVAAILAVAEHGTHQLGTTRMGRDRRDGVVDENLKTFDVSNLYVVGSSIFPTSSQANPTFTAVALAVRLAEHLRLSG